MKRAILIGVVAGLLLQALPVSASRVQDLVIHAGDVPRRLVGYGLVVGLEGTGDRSFGGIASRNATVHSVVNLLRRFGVEVPAEYLRLRNVAAVVVTAEVSPYLRSGGRFDVQVSALGDAVSLDGGVLWITPLVTDPDQPALATAQGALLISSTEETSYSPYSRGGNSARIPDGGVLEVDPPAVAGREPKLFLKKPDRITANRIATAINGALGDSIALVEDPGAIRLNPGENHLPDFLASVDTLEVDVEGPARIVIHGREGTVVAGGEVRVGRAVIHHHGITLQIGGDTAGDQPPAGLVRMGPRSMVQDVAAGLHAAGARPEEIAAIFEALRDAGALRAEVIVR